MSVYVDGIIDYGAVATANGLRSTLWCHLTADDRDELHAFAERIGLRRTWFQDQPHGWHYDLTPGKRAAAVRAGAVQITAREMGQLVMARREAKTKPHEEEQVSSDAAPAGPPHASPAAWARFQVFTIITSEHHIWTGAVGDDGYPSFHDPDFSAAHGATSPTARATRWRLWAEFGPIEDKHVAMHRCDIPLCVRLDHLVGGTQSENLLTAAGRDHVARSSRYGGRRDGADRRTQYAASLALRAAVRAAVDAGLTDPDALAAIVEEVLAAGDPHVDQPALFDL